LLGLALPHAPPAFAMPPPERTAALRRGVNITGWFRYPASRDPTALHAFLGHKAMVDLRTAGFTFVRLAVDPTVLDGPSMRRTFLDQVRRLREHGLAVVISPHPVSWNLDTNPEDRRRFVAFWRDLAQALRGLDPGMTFPEVLNEPVFHDDPAAWWDLQDDLLAVIRAALPDATIILTGQDWGSIAGLLALPPSGDPNVVYSFHFYDPPELTSLAAWRPGLDRAALAQLPFPVSDLARCQSIAATATDQATGDLMRFYCASNTGAASLTARVQAAAFWARQHDAALLAGEFGANAALNPKARLAWLRLVRETCAANGIGWALWGYDDVMGFDIRRPPGNNPVLDHSVLEALGLSVP
jgi:endoglucanase